MLVRNGKPFVMKSQLYLWETPSKNVKQTPTSHHRKVHHINSRTCIVICLRRTSTIRVSALCPLLLLYRNRNVLTDRFPFSAVRNESASSDQSESSVQRSTKNPHIFCLGVLCISYIYIVISPSLLNIYKSFKTCTESECEECRWLQGEKKM